MQVWERYSEMQAWIERERFCDTYMERYREIGGEIVRYIYVDI